jgi:peptidoglycan hydrolase CwlO-like protein
MPKTTEDYQRDLYQLFAQAGEKQYIIRGVRGTLDATNSDLNTLNQKIETLQKAFASHYKAEQAAASATSNPSPLKQEAASEATAEEATKNV